VADEQFRWWRIPIGSGRSFPIKRKDLDVALAATPVSLYEVVSHPQWYRTPAEYFDATGIPQPRSIDTDTFLPLSSAAWSGIDGPAGPRAHSMAATVSIYAVPSERRAELHQRMVEEGLPLLLGWISAVERGPETGRTVNRRLALYLNRDRIEQIEG
jgi:hypothetical protein